MPDRSATTQSTAAWRAVLEDREVRRWHDKLALTRTGTADERARILYRYCRALKTTPAAIADRAKDQNGGRRAVQDQLQDFVTLLHGPHMPSDHGEDDGDDRARARCRRGHSPGYAENFVKAVKSWCDHNEVALRRIAIGDTDATPSVEDEVLLTPEQLRGVLAAASPRGRVVLSLVAFAGLRPESIGLHDASDGLVIGDLPDVKLEDGSVRIGRTPLQVVVRRDLSKVRKRYFSFLPAEAAEYVRDYLEHRMARGEVLTPDVALVRPDYNRERQGRPAHMRGWLFLTTQAVTSEIRDALRSCGHKQRPYSLRAYAITRFMSAERDGKLASLDRMFISGRKDAIDLRYSHFKSVSANVVEELRRSYAACEPYLGAKPSSTMPPGQLEEARATYEAARARLEVITTRIEARLAALEKNRNEATRLLLKDPEAVAVLRKVWERAVAKDRGPDNPYRGR